MRTSDELATRFELRDLVDRYALAADGRDNDGLAALFAPDGRIEFHPTGNPDSPPSHQRAGRDEISAAIAGLTKYRVTTHLVGQHRAELLDADHATAVTYCMAHHISVGADGRETDRVMAIRYFDRYVRIDGAWFFEVRGLVTDWVETKPLDQT